MLDQGGGIDELRAAGVQVKLSQASTGRVSGISYSRTPEPGHDRSKDRGEAEPIWFKGSQLGKAYGWNQVSDQLRDTSHQPSEPSHQPSEPDTDHQAGAQHRQHDDAGQLARSRDGRDDADDHGREADAAQHADDENGRGGADGAAPQAQPGAGPAPSPGGAGGTLPEPPALELSLELKPPSVEQRRALALEAARERAAERARQQARDRDQDRGR